MGEGATDTDSHGRAPAGTGGEGPVSRSGWHLLSRHLRAPTLAVRLPTREEGAYSGWTSQGKVQRVHMGGRWDRIRADGGDLRPRRLSTCSISGALFWQACADVEA